METLRTEIQQTIKQLFDTDTQVQLEWPEAQFGDYATNVAMQLAKPLGRNPREIAEEIAVSLRDNPQIAEVSVAGPGFINLSVSDTALIYQARVQPRRDRTGTTVVIETNNPNPFKPMHIGHAYNAILADTMANLLEASGADTKRVSYHGDIGAHVGRSMWSLLRYCSGDIEKLKQIPATERNAFMGKMYAEGARAAKEDEAARHDIDELAKQSFTREDPLYAAIYDIVFAWSFEQIDAILARIGSVPIERRYLESETEAIGVETVRRNVPRVFIESGGALVFEGSKHGAFDNVFVGANGHGLYGARDLGLIQLKARDFPAMSECIIVTGEEQGGYFRGVIAAAELALPELKGKLINCPTGLVKLSTGKMSSRTGDVVTIEWLFDEFAKAIEVRGGMLDDKIIAGALRYQFLKVKIGGDVVFDINEAVSLTGNTGSYLQYAHARACSILNKASSVSELGDVEFDAAERLLVRKLSEYAETIDHATSELMPHYVCTYLYELAQEFNRFYEKSRIIGDEREQIRLGLVVFYRDTLARGLGLLGITAPESM